MTNTVSGTLPNPYEVNVRIEKVHKDAIIPTYSHDDDACCDLYTVEDYIIPVQQWRLLRTGVAIEIPSGFETQVRPRSGMALKNGAIIHWGSVDAQFRNEIRVLMLNMGEKPIVIRKGDRVAQMSIKPVYHFNFQEVEELNPSDRGLGGWGSTGK